MLKKDRLPRGPSVLYCQFGNVWRYAVQMTEVWFTRAVLATKSAVVFPTSCPCCRGGATTFVRVAQKGSVSPAKIPYCQTCKSHVEQGVLALFIGSHKNCISKKAAVLPLGTGPATQYAERYEAHFFRIRRLEYADDLQRLNRPVLQPLIDQFMSTRVGELLVAPHIFAHVLARCGATEGFDFINKRIEEVLASNSTLEVAGRDAFRLALTDDPRGLPGVLAWRKHPNFYAVDNVINEYLTKFGELPTR